MTGNQTKLIGSTKVNFDNWMEWRSIRVKLPSNSEAQLQASHTCDEIGLIVNKDYIARFGEVRFASKDSLAFFMMNWRY
jgi:hypothetical protein|tara:strand:+ start:341 stop:577 length:237 start_codon:yes stop_codon:yes gene_type:complete